MALTPNFRRNKFFFITGGVYVITVIAFTKGLRNGLILVTLEKDTIKMVLSTLMAVSGSIIGFLVIYLSLALEGLKRNYGKQAVAMFRKETSIWVSCGFFCILLLFATCSFLWTDTPGFFGIWSFNIACVSFAIGIAGIVPFGIAILSRTDTTESIDQLISKIQPADFRISPEGPSFTGPMYWILTEVPDNKVDKISAILYHNITEDNSRLSADILLSFLNRISILAEVSKGTNIERMILRYFDMLSTAFDYSKINNNEVVIKTMLECLISSSNLVAKWKKGPDIVERMFGVIKYMTQYLIEQNKEQMVNEAFWSYYHMAEAQVRANLPPAEQTWDIQENGRFLVLDNEKGAANERRFDALDKAFTYDLSELVDRSFYIDNRFMNRNVVRMNGLFLEMLVYELNISIIPKSLLGSSLADQASKFVIRLISPTNPDHPGYLDLYLGNSGLMAALEEDARFSLAIFDNYIEICDSIIEQEALNRLDLRKIGGLGRRIIADSAKFTDVLTIMIRLLEINRKAKLAIETELQGRPDRRRKNELNEMMDTAKEDLASWYSMYERKASENKELGLTIKKYLEGKV